MIFSIDFQVNDMKAELEKHREELIKLEDDDPWHLDHQNSCPVKVKQQLDHC